MNLKLVLQLSAFGLIMAFGTISLIPEKVEPAFWLVIFSFCAYVVAKVCKNRYFLHGFLLSIVNSVWITAVHFIWFNKYVANHPDMANMGNSMGYFAIHPRALMLVFGLPAGAVFGIVQGLFCYVACLMMTAKTTI